MWIHFAFFECRYIMDIKRSEISDDMSVVQISKLEIDVHVASSFQYGNVFDTKGHGLFFVRGPTASIQADNCLRESGCGVIWHSPHRSCTAS